MMSKKSKKKNRGRRPPLSLLDKSIYWLILLLSFIFSLLFVFCFEDITTAIAFQNTKVVAYNSHASFLFVMPLLLYVEISALVFCIMALEEKNRFSATEKFSMEQPPGRKTVFPYLIQEGKAFM